MKKVVLFFVYFMCCFTLFSQLSIALPTSDLCVQAYENNQTPGQCYKGDACSKWERVSIICEYAQKMKKAYAGYTYKNDMLPNFNSQSHLDACIQAEFDAKSDSTLLFQDRWRACIAGFQDTHMHLMTSTEFPHVSVGLQLIEIDGKVYIKARVSNLVKLYEAKNEDVNWGAILAVGNEILEIDGKTPELLIKEFAPYIPASSEKYRRASALNAATGRSFRYPTKSHLTIKIKDDNEKTYELELPWRVTENYLNRYDTDKYFKSLNIPVWEEALWTYSEQEGQYKPISENWEGYMFSQSLFDEDLLTTLKSPSGREVYSLGIIPLTKSIFATLQASDASQQSNKAAGGDVEKGYREINAGESSSSGAGNDSGESEVAYFSGGYNFCYAQIKTFNESRIVVGEKHAFVWAPLLSFLTTCEDRGLKLILDLRNNPGGNSFYPPSLAHYLIEDYSKNRVGNSTYAIRTNFSWMAQAYNSGRAIANAPRVIQGPTAEHMYPVLRQAHEEAYKAGKSKSNIAVVDYPGFDEDEMDEYQGFLYTGDMITLISPYCISACDRMSAILKRTKRSPIYGTATNGTGLGTAVPWYESNGEYYVGIPSYLFGVTDERIKNADEQQVTFDYDIYQEEWLLENRPTDADHQLSITLDDLRAGDYLGSYRKTVVNALIADDVTKLKN